jgi:hypothetical protein
VHQGSSLSIRQARSHLLTDSFQAGMKQLDDVGPIYHDLGMRQHPMNGIMVRCPHVGTHDLNLFTDGPGQLLQVADHAGFVSLSKQINDLVMLNICDHTSVLVQQVQFVDAQIAYACLDEAMIQIIGEFVEQEANGSFCQARLISKTGKRFAHRCRLDVVDQALRHEVMLIHVRNGFKKASTTPTTAVAPAVNDDPNMLVSDRMIHEELLLHIVLVEFGMPTMGTTRGRSATLRLDMEVMFILIYCKDVVLSQPQNVQKMLSPLQGLLHEFFCSKKNPVAERWNFPTGFRQTYRAFAIGQGDSPHFYDGALVCTDVKKNEIPRTFTISRIFGQIRLNHRIFGFNVRTNEKPCGAYRL